MSYKIVFREFTSQQNLESSPSKTRSLGCLGDEDVEKEVPIHGWGRLQWTIINRHFSKTINLNQS